MHQYQYMFKVWDLLGCTFCVIVCDFVLQYDNVLMEESAQILEIESFIPLMLQVTHSIAFTGVPVTSFLFPSESTGWL